MIARIFISLAIPALSGFFLVDSLLKKEKAGFAWAVFKACLAVGVGFGISSALFFIWLAVSGRSNAGFVSFVISELALLLILWFLWISVKKNTAQLLFRDRKQSAKFDIIYPVFCGIFIMSVIEIIMLFITSPHGYWDAWAIWNMRARFIFRAGQYWTDAFLSPLSWSHTDYPLLIPLFVARGWKYISCDSVIMPILTAGLFFVSITCIIAASICMLYGRQKAGLAGLVLLGTPFFITHSASQYADIPLAFYILAALVLLCMYERRQENTGLIFLAGLSSGFAAWTKNEGTLFLAAVVIGQFFATVPKRGWAAFLARMTVFFKGALPVLLILAYFKLRLAPAGDLFAADLLHPRGWLFIAGRFFRTAADFGQWPVLFLPILVLSGLLFGIKINPEDKPSIIGSSVTLAVILLGYYGIFLITPHDAGWHVSTSLDRLFLQIWPSAIFLFFQLAALPEDIV